jgi:hypothetical protein
VETWFLLFGGTSPDGRGQPVFVGRTTDKAKARKHYAKCRKNPHSIGSVWIVTDSTFTMASFETNWGAI